MLQAHLKSLANLAAAYPYYTAVASAGHSAALMPFQRQSAKFSPDKNVISAASPVHPARQFSGINAINAAIAVTTATFATF